MKLFTPLAILLISSSLYAQIPVNPGGGDGGGGTVTSVSASGGSPVVGVSVANPTTTPAITITVPTQAARSVLMNNTGSTAAPTFTTAPLFSGGSIPNLSGASNLGDIPYQTGAGSTAFVPGNNGIGTFLLGEQPAGDFTAPTLIDFSTLIATSSSNLAGGALGSLPYQSNTNATALLSPNTTTTVKVLTQVGNGTVSASPVWTTPTGTGSPVLSVSPTLTGMLTTARITLNQATGTAPLTITSTTPVANLTVSNHPTELYCGTTTTCSNTATTGGRVIFGSAAMVSGVAAVTGISPVFPDTNYSCTASIKASGITAELLTVANTSSSAITITSSSVTSTSTVSYICVR